MKRPLLAVFLLALATGCAPLPAGSPDIGLAPRGLRSEDLAAAVWTARPQVLRLHQTARFSFRGREVPMIGLMELDTRQLVARLVAVNDMGVKLFDLSVSEDAFQENYLLPQLASYPRFGEAVAVSLRRIFLVPRPEPSVDRLQTAGDRYLLDGTREGQRVEFLFGGDPVALVEKKAEGEENNWRVVYRNYRQVPGLSYPQEIMLEDLRAGYRLELRMESVTQGHEQTGQ